MKRDLIHIRPSFSVLVENTCNSIKMSRASFGKMERSYDSSKHRKIRVVT